MKPYSSRRREIGVLCLGAHSDDIEIGAGATLLSMQERGVRLDVHWCEISKRASIFISSPISFNKLFSLE